MGFVKTDAELIEPKNKLIIKPIK